MTSQRSSIGLWIALCLALILGLIWQFYPLSDAKARIDQLPLSGKNFSGFNLSITDTEKTYFANVNMIKRIYKIGNQRAFIYILDGTHNRHAVHDPTYCFRGSGWEIASQKPFLIPGGSATLFRITKGLQTREALLWFSDGKEHYGSPFRYWYQTSLRRLTLGYSGPEPVLVVIQPDGGSALNWEELLKEFPEILKI